MIAMLLIEECYSKTTAGKNCFDKSSFDVSGGHANKAVARKYFQVVFCVSSYCVFVFSLTAHPPVYGAVFIFWPTGFVTVRYYHRTIIIVGNCALGHGVL